MKESTLQSVWVVSCVVILIRGISGSASLSSIDSLLGVSPEDEGYFKGLSSHGAIKCKDGSKTFTESQFNDDFCDCPDGSDEPGTSACPNGKFFCRNTGHAPLVLHSSRVNDGICDCCDGSEEYNSKIKCSNTCWEAGEVARDKLKKRIATYQDGVTIRKQEIEQAKLAIAKEEAELSKLKNAEKVLSGLVQQLKEHKEQIEEAEKRERQQKEKEEKEEKERKDLQTQKEEKERKDSEVDKEKEFTSDKEHEASEFEHNSIYDKIGTLDQPPQESAERTDYVVLENFPKDETQEDKVDSIQKPEGLVDDKVDLNTNAEDTESLSREELGKTVASRWTGEKNEQPTTKELDASLEKDQENFDEKPNESNYEEYNDHDSEDDAHEYDDDDDDSEDQVDDFGDQNHDDSSSSHKPESDDELDFSDMSNTSSPSWLEKIRKMVRSILKSVDLFRTPIDISEAARIRKEYETSSAKLSKMQSRISSLTKKLKQDFGPEKEFYSFYDQCFEGKNNKYTYKIYPFKEATQVEGYSVTRLGNWGKFEDSYRIMQFSNGENCWNGPDRSLKVKLRCGLTNEVTDIDEPSRCEYMALLSTPALCLDSKLKELEEKLEYLNKEMPTLGHDEL